MDTRDPYAAPESAGVMRESLQHQRHQMVPVTLLALAVVLAFLTGAVSSGVLVYCACERRRLRPSRRGSMNSVTKLSGLFQTQVKDAAGTIIRAEPQLDLAGLPTPEATPLQPRRKTREWERNQNLINACAKELGTPVICAQLPLRPSPGHIPSVVVLPLRAELPDDPEATLQYRTLKGPAEGEGVPPRVPQREASLCAVPQMGKRVEPSLYGRGFPVKKQLNGSSLAHRKRSFGCDTPPPAPQRVDSIQLSGLYASYGSLRPDVPPKPALLALASRGQASQSGT